MLAFLRFIGIINAAIWFGALIFFTAVVGPAFFSDDMTKLLGKIYSGAAAQIVLDRYFLFQTWSLAIALVHLFVEWLYTGRPWNRIALTLLAIFLGLNIFATRYAVPRMKHLHLVMYAVQSTPAERAQAKKTFGTMHGISQILNIVVIAGALYNLWQITQGSSAVRFGAGSKFRG